MQNGESKCSECLERDDIVSGRRGGFLDSFHRNEMFNCLLDTWGARQVPRRATVGQSSDSVR